MKTPQNLVDRRTFLGLGSAALAAGATGCRTISGGEEPVDPNLSAFLSDIHIAKKGTETQWGPQPDYQNAMLEKAVDGVLALSPRPARAVVFGDVALWFGFGADYDIAKRILSRLTDAGIELFVTTGNHDHRDGIFSRFPKQKEITPVPGRVVSVIDLGTADLLLLDSLDETGVKEGGNNRVGGALDDAQWAWLEKTAKEWKRPFFVGAHHAPDDLNGRKARRLLAPVKNFVGWIHGHDHHWQTDWFAESYASRKICRTVVLPSTGWWGDIGFCTMRTGDGFAKVELRQRDFYFPGPLAAGEARPALWDEIVAENRGVSCTFRW